MAQIGNVVADQHNKIILPDGSSDGGLVQITANTTISLTNAKDYNGKTLIFNGEYTVIVSAADGDLPIDFGFLIKPPTSGKATIASGGVVKLDGTTQSKSYAETDSKLLALVYVGTNSFVIMTGANITAAKGYNVSPFRLLPKLLKYLYTVPTMGASQSQGGLDNGKGFPVLPWKTATVYAKGAIRSNAGNLYVCDVGGTSGTTGPVSVNGNQETDGTVKWRWIGGDVYAWKANTAYVRGQYVNNLGFTYVCVTAGTSAGSGGPNAASSSVADNTCVWGRMNTVFYDSKNGIDTNAGTTPALPKNRIAAGGSVPDWTIVYVAAGSIWTADFTTTSTLLVGTGWFSGISVYDRTTGNEIIDQPNPFHRALQGGWLTQEEMDTKYFYLWGNGPENLGTNIPGTNGKVFTGAARGSTSRFKARGFIARGGAYGGLVAQAGGQWVCEDFALIDNYQQAVAGVEGAGGGALRIEGTSGDLGVHTFTRFFADSHSEDGIYGSVGTPAQDFIVSDFAIRHQPYSLSNGNHSDGMQIGQASGTPIIRRGIIEHDVSKIWQAETDGLKPVGTAFMSDQGGGTANNHYILEDMIIVSNSQVTNVVVPSDNPHKRCLFGLFCEDDNIAQGVLMHAGNGAYTQQDCTNVLSPGSNRMARFYNVIVPTKTGGMDIIA